MQLFKLEVRYTVTAADIWGPHVRDSAAAPLLTKIERRLLRHAAQGLSDKQIASAVNRNPYTVRYHMLQVRKKLNLRTRFQMGFYAWRLLSLEEGND